MIKRNFIIFIALLLSNLSLAYKDPLLSWEKPDDPRFDWKTLGEQLHISWESLENTFKKREDLRKSFRDLQKEYINKYKEIKDNPDANFLELSEEFTKALKKWVAGRLNELVPDELKNELAFIIFGSMARKESGPVTDLEVAIVWNEKYKDKDERDSLSFSLANKVAREFENLIGHPEFGRKGFRLDEADASPFHLAVWAQNLSIDEAYCWADKVYKYRNESDEVGEFRKTYYWPFEGSWVFASTPKALAALATYSLSTFPEKKDLMKAISSKYMSYDFILDNLKNCKELDNNEKESLAEGLSARMLRTEQAVATFFRLMQRNSAFLFGQKDLYTEFKNAKDKLLDSKDYDEELINRQLIAISAMKKSVKDFKEVGEGMFVSGKLPDLTDLKRNHYRLEEQILTNLSLYYNLGVQNSGKIIIALRDKGIFGKEFAKNYLERANQLARLRWKEQTMIGEQLKPRQNYLSVKAYDEAVDEINAEIKKLDNTIKTSKDENELIMARYNRGHLQDELRVLEKLKPMQEDSVFDPKEIEYLNDTLLPAEVDLFKRLQSFLGSKGKPNENAFQDLS
jgi:predicted nucleotidyltransferase